MTIPISNLTYGTSASATPTTASVTVGNNQALIVVVCAAQNAGDSPDAVVSGLGLIWSNVYGGKLTGPSGRRGANVFLAVNTSGSPQTGTISIVCTASGGNTFQACIWSVDLLGDGVDPSAPIGTPVSATPGSVTNYTLSSVGSPGTGDAVYAWATNASALGAFAKPTGYTYLIGNDSSASIEPVRSMQTCYDNSASPNPTPTWPVTSANISAIGGFLIKATSGGGGDTNELTAAVVGSGVVAGVLTQTQQLAVTAVGAAIAAGALSIANPLTAAAIGSVLGTAALQVFSRVFRAPATIPGGTSPYVFVLTGTAPNYTLVAQGPGTLAGGYVDLPASIGTPGDKFAMVVMNWDGSLITTNVRGGFGIATVMDI